MLQFNQKHFLVIVKTPSPILHNGDFKAFLKSHLNSCTVYNYNFTNISCFDFDKMKALKIFDRKNVNAISDRLWPYSAPQVSSSAAMVLQFTISQVMMFPSHSCQFVSSNCETNNWQKVSFPNLYPTLRTCHFCQCYLTFYSIHFSYQVEDD